MGAADYDQAVRAVGGDILGVGLVKRVHPVAHPATFFTKMDGTIVRVDWNGPEPGSAIQNAVKAAIENARPIENRLDILRLKRRSGQMLTSTEQQELLDLLMGV